MGEYVHDFRHFMNLMEFEETEPASQPAEPEGQEPTQETEDKAKMIAERLGDMVFKLRAHSSPAEGDFALGEEAGCEMAAAMLETLLRQLGDPTE